MGFLKRHGFYLALVAGLVIINGALYAMMIRPWGTGAAEGLEQKVQQSKEIGNLRRGGKNADQVKAEQQRVETIKKNYTEMMNVARQTNRRGREPLEMTSATGETFPIFPVDEERYENESVRFGFAERYTEAMDDLFASLNATLPPTQQEIDTATRLMINYMEKKLPGESEDAPVVLPAGVDPPSDYTGAPTDTGRYGPGRGTDMYDPTGGTDMYGPGAGTDMYGPGAGTRMYGPGAGTDMYDPAGGRTARTGRGARTDPAREVDPAEAQKLAIQNLEILRTTKPGTSLYADRYLAFHDYILPQDERADMADMWKAQANYWLHKYVVDTIKATNGDGATIEDAVVKRLVQINIGQAPANRSTIGAMTLYEGESEPAAAAGDTRDAAGAGTGTAGAGYDGGTGMPGYGGGTGMPGDGGGTTESDVVQQLTERTCTQRYDVVNFDLTVVASSSQLHQFLKNLVSNGFYTIQKIEQYETNPVRTVNAGTRPTRGADRPSEYYYGSQPVVTAVIHIEALFFTDWERDLMPVEMLQRLPDEALRPEDEQRIAAASAGMTDAGTHGQNTYGN